jgi:hypothetical protein
MRKHCVYNGELWIGGGFTSTNSVPNTGRLAKWTGSAWMSPAVTPTQLDGDVYAFEIIASPAIIYVGGSFVGPYKSIMRNGTTVIGVDEISIPAESIFIYPNPASEQLNLRIDSEIKNPKVDIYNMMGEKVYSESLNSDFETVNTSQFSTGIYFVKIISEENGSHAVKVFTQKLVIE